MLCSSENNKQYAQIVENDELYINLFVILQNKDEIINISIVNQILYFFEIMQFFHFIVCIMNYVEKRLSTS